MQKKYGYDSAAAATPAVQEDQKQAGLTQQRKADEQQRFEQGKKYSREQSDRNNPFAEEERKDRYELLKADSRIQENLPEVISYFRGKQDDDPSSIQAQTHQKIVQLCEELSTIVPKIIAAKADNFVSGLISRQREIFKSLDGILAAEHTAEMETRLHVGEYAADRIRIDREYNQKALALLNE